MNSYPPGPGGGGYPPQQPYPGRPGYPSGPGGQPGWGWAPGAPVPGGNRLPHAMKPGPKKFWYGIGAALLVLGLALGIGLGVGMIVSALGERPTGETTFASGESTTVAFDAGASRVVFVDVGGEGHRVKCRIVDGPSQDVQIAEFDGNLVLNQWEAVFTVTAEQAGDYTISCIGEDSDTFGVGGDAGVGSLILGVFATIAGVFLVLAGTVVLIVTAVLRRRRSSAW